MRNVISALVILAVAALFARDIHASVMVDHLSFLSLGDVLGIGGPLGHIWLFALAAILLAFVLALPVRNARSTTNADAS